MPAIESTQPSTHQSIAQTQLNKPVLKVGQVGPAVLELQKLLTLRETYSGDFDSIFDSSVDRAVKAFQHRVFLVEDGIVGQLTWQALYSGAPVNMPVLQQGIRGEAVTTLQKLLLTAGDFKNVVNGVFGPHTDAAVRAFQKRKGLVADGIVGNKTWFMLSKVPH